jgi:hypothetical protein
MLECESIIFRTARKKVEYSNKQRSWSSCAAKKICFTRFIQKTNSDLSYAAFTSTDRTIAGRLLLFKAVVRRLPPSCFEKPKPASVRNPIKLQKRDCSFNKTTAEPAA